MNDCVVCRWHCLLEALLGNVVVGSGRLDLVGWNKDIPMEVAGTVKEVYTSIYIHY